MHAVVRQVLRQAEILTAMGLVFVASWAFVAWMTLSMAHPAVRVMMPVDAAWSWSTAVAVAVMWGGMMVAMMLPSAAPMILTFDALERRNAQAGRAASRSLVFAGAYLLVWIGYSALAAGAQWALQASGMLTPMIVSSSDRLTAGLLIVAGLYQLTPLKQACLRRCRTPAGFLMAEWRDGMARRPDDGPEARPLLRGMLLGAHAPPVRRGRHESGLDRVPDPRGGARKMAAAAGLDRSAIRRSPALRRRRNFALNGHAKGGGPARPLRHACRRLTVPPSRTGYAWRS